MKSESERGERGERGERVGREWGEREWESGREWESDRAVGRAVLGGILFVR